MGKTNWNRVFLGGLLAGVVLIVLGFAAWAIYLQGLWSPEMEALGHPVDISGGGYVFSIIFSLVIGILAVWLYSAIRPRYGAGPKTAIIAGIAFWVLSSLIAAISLGSMGLFAARLLVIDSLTGLVLYVVATLLGAWVYKEESQ
jgi:magnesium-transporting ATPase (P-type)